MGYKCGYKDEFIVPVFTQESGYWEQVMKPRLQEQGWYIAEVDCAGVEDIVDFGRRLLRALNFSVGDNEYVSPIWYENLVGEISGVSMRQGFFVYYKNFEDVLSMADGLNMEGYARYSVDILYIMNAYYPRRPMWRDDEYEVLFGYGFEVSKDSLPRVEEYFEGHEIIFAGPDTEYPWSQQEERKKKYFPNGFPDPRYDENGIWVTDPNIYPESTSYTGSKDS